MCKCIHTLEQSKKKAEGKGALCRVTLLSQKKYCISCILPFEVTYNLTFFDKEHCPNEEDEVNFELQLVKASLWFPLCVYTATHVYKEQNSRKTKRCE